MKPLHLRIQAFGPFAQTVEINFRALAAGGLFLIHGPTGAGKTSILDGICFALFGRASGTERQPEALRSDRAPADLPTEVELEFSLGPDAYRVTRQPKQELAKKRGDGFKTSRSEGKIEKLTPSDANQNAWRLVASGVDKTDAVIVGLLGMNEEQFRQVVVLPQGQFRKFLSANSDDREELLEQLFQTHRFRELTESMVHRKNAIERDVLDRRGRALAALQAFDVATLSELELKRESAKARLLEIETQLPKLESQHADAADQLKKGESRAQLRSELSALEVKRSLLAQELTAIDDFREQLNQERRARPVAQQHQKILDTEKELERLNQDVETMRTNLAQLDIEAAKAREAREKVIASKHEFEKWELELRSKSEALPNARRLLQDEGEAAVKLERANSLDEIKAKQSKALDELLQKRPELEKKIDLLQAATLRGAELAAKREQLENEVNTHKRWVAEIAKCRALRLRRDECRKISENSEIEKNKARTQLQNLKIAYHRSEAARLASELEDGEACPVCGSLDHPSKASPVESAPSIEAVEQAEERFSKIESEWQRLQAELHLRSKDHTDLETEISKHLKVPESLWDEHMSTCEAEIRARLEPVNAALKEAKESRLALELLRQEKDAFTQKITQLEKALTEARNLSDQAKNASVEASALVAELKKRVPLEHRDPLKLESEIRALKARVDEYRVRDQATAAELERKTMDVATGQERLRTLGEQLALKNLDLKKARALIENELMKSGFKDVESALKAAISESDVVRIELKVKNFELEWSRVDGRLIDLKAEVQKLPEQLPDLENLRALFQDLDQFRANFKAERLELLRHLEALELLWQRSKTNFDEISKLEESYKTIGRLAEIAAGRAPNISRVNFQRYVLASRLDEVLEQASRRLRQMSSGRFQLRRARSLEDKRKNSGLELEVEDSFTGTSRATASLSGGEGFMASLALALGVADVVQMHLGGIRLEAVFVDEGFGTLDPEALELAMRTLTDLQAGGRLVGIISHVPELRDQIARRLAVRKGINGSEIVWESNVS